MEEINQFFHSSILNHNDFIYSTNSKNIQYIIQIAGIKDINFVIFNIQKYYSNFFSTFKEVNIQKSFTKDENYVKENGYILKLEKKFETDELLLQNSISLSGYSLSKKEIKIKQWGDDSKDDDKIDQTSFIFEKAKNEKKIIFSREGIYVSFFEDKVEFIFTNSNFEFIVSILDFILQNVYFNYPFILTLEKELDIKSNKVVKEMKNTQAIFKYNYILDKKYEISFLIKDYYYTIPCIKFNLHHEVYLLDCYDNLRKIENTDKEDFFYVVEGIFNIINHYWKFICFFIVLFKYYITIVLLN